MYHQAIMMIAAMVLLTAADISAQATGGRRVMHNNLRNSLMEEQRTGISSAQARAMADQVLRASAEDLQRSGVAYAATRSLVDQVLRDSMEDHQQRSGMPLDVARSAAEQDLRSKKRQRRAVDEISGSSMPMSSSRSTNAFPLSSSAAEHVLRNLIRDHQQRFGMPSDVARSVAEQELRSIYKKKRNQEEQGKQGGGGMDEIDLSGFGLGSKRSMDV